MLNLLPQKKNASNKPLLYKDILDKKYHLMYLNASTQSGKTYSLTQLLLNYYIVPHSNQKIFIICPTVKMCETWKGFIKLASNFNQVILFETVDKDTLGLIKEMRNKEPVSDYVDGCENIIIIDDMSEKTRGTLLTGLTKKYRHWKSCMFICSQAFMDLNPAAKAQLDCISLWKGLNIRHLENLHENLLGTFNMTFDDFMKMYNEMTDEKYSFMFIKIKNKEMKKGWI